MSAVSTWRLFAYMDDDDDCVHDEHRLCAPWQLPHLLDWCTARGYDHVYFSRVSDGTTRFEKRPTPAGIVHQS